MFLDVGPKLRKKLRIWGDKGLEFLQGRRDKLKLSWWYNIVSMHASF